MELLFVDVETVLTDAGPYTSISVGKTRRYQRMTSGLPHWRFSTDFHDAYFVPALLCV